MQKSLQKPENWQDFESLSKKLWGELWEIPHKIKKNGRLGQPQNGVDISGIPKNESEYWGIQCKGKSDYLNSVLTIKEIDEEVEKAKSFIPKLKVFIIATTQNKDVAIEQYVREKDIKNRKDGSFEIILFCWEDIADLITENRETNNWYLGINKFRDKYDVSISFSNNQNEIFVEPKFLKLTTKYRKPPNFSSPIFNGKIVLPRIPQMFESNEVNRSWCSLEIIIKNTGSVVLEDWYLNLKLNSAKKIDDNFNVHFMLSAEVKKMMYETRTLFCYEDKNEFLYQPCAKEPLIQKSGRKFKIYFIPNFIDKEIEISWNFFARDFDKSGKMLVKLNPDFKESTKYISVESEQDEIEDKIEIMDLIEPKNNYA